MDIFVPMIKRSVMFHDGFASAAYRQAGTNHENKPIFWVMVTKPVSYIVKGLRSREFKDESRL